MDQISKILGTKEARTAREYIDIVESAICEGYGSARELNQEKLTNIFGRQLHYHASGSMACISGMASSGLRCAVMLEGSELSRNFSEVQDAVRMQLPVVIHSTSRKLSSQGYTKDFERQSFYSLSSSGAIQLYCRNVQELVDFSLISHKLAEEALLPVIVATDSNARMNERVMADIPSVHQIRSFLGDPDGMVTCSSPAQQMLFGEQRRRIPNWFHFDLPMASGLKKDEKALAFEAAAAGRFFQEASLDILENILEEFGQLTGRRYFAISGYQMEKAQYMFLVQGAAYETVCAALESLPKKKKALLGCLNLSVFHPLPSKLLRQLMNNCKGLTVLEPVSPGTMNAAPLARTIAASLATSDHQSTSVYSGLYGSEIGPDAVLMACDNMLPDGKQQRNFYLDISFTKKKSSFPKHQVMLEAIGRLYPEIDKDSFAGDSNAIEKDKAKSNERGFSTSVIPEIIRRYRDQGPPYSSLSRFQDHTTLFFQQELAKEMVADPFQALPSSPAATASLLPQLKLGGKYPVFHADKCTACGECYTHCPHGALPPAVVNMEALIRKGIDMLSESGKQVRQITPLLKGWAKLAAKEIRDSEQLLTDARDFLAPSFEKMATQTGMSGEKKEKTEAEAASIIQMITGIPFAATKLFFTNRESIEKGTGELFSMAVDPFSCTACGLCTAVCPEDALSMAELDKDRLDHLIGSYRKWENLPETAPEIIEYASNKEGYNPFASLMLSRKHYQSMSGGHPSENGAGTKSMLHAISAAVDSVVSANMTEQLSLVREQIELLSSSIRSTLIDSMPLDELEQWSTVLKDSGLSRLSIGELTSRLDELSHLKPLETEPVKRKLGLLSELRDLEKLMNEGPTGQGRAHYGMLLSMSDAFDWASSYPANPFSAPLLCQWSGEASEKVRGLMHAHLRHNIDNIKLLRRSELEAKGKYEPRIHDQEIASLAWENLDDKEKRFIPPIWLVGESSVLTDQSLGQMQELLGSTWPVRICIIENCVPENNGRAASLLFRRQAGLISLLAMQNAYILSASMADPDGLYQGLKEGLNHSGPFLLRVYAAAGERHNTAGGDWTGLAELATNTRAFPLLKYQPSKSAGSLISAGLSLQANPSLDEDWTTRQINYLAGEEIENADYSPTYADWLFSMKDWREHFQLLEDKLEEPIELAKYLSLPENEKKGKVPVLTRVDEKGNLIHFRVSGEVIHLVEHNLNNWNAIRDLAGLMTPFPEKLEKKVKGELSLEFERKAVEMQQEFDRQKALIEQQHLESMHARLGDRLLVLSQSKTEV